MILIKVKKMVKKVREKFRMFTKEKCFKDVSYEWLEYKQGQVKQSSFYNYKFVVEKYLIPFYGDENMRQIHDFSEFIDELSTSLAPKTIRDIFNVLMMIFNYYEGTYNKKLRYKRAILPRLEKKEVEIFTSREKEKIENYCIKQNTLKTLGILICLNTGIRIGELCALTWENIELTEKCIYIRKTAQRIYR